MDVSIIIVNWNTREITRDCLASIYRETHGIDFEVILVDNASGDGSVAMVEKEFPQIRLIANTDNRGFAAANNQGMAIARGRYILLLNSDTVILDNAIARSVVFAEKHPEAAVIGCRVLNPDKSLQRTCFMYPSLLNMFLSGTYLYKFFPRNRFFGREQMTWWDRDDVREVEVVTGCFMLVRKEAIEQVGMLDEAFFMYGEETDWCYRFRKNGWKILFTPSAEIIHLHGASSIQKKAKMTWQLRGGILYFMKKHKPYIIYVIACLLTALFFGLRIPYWTLRTVCACSKERKAQFQILKTYTLGCLKALKGWRGLVIKTSGAES